MVIGLSAQENNGKWAPVGNRKIRVVHWGICHSHSKVNGTTGVRENKTMEVRLYLKSVNEAAKLADYKQGLNNFVFPAIIDRYEGQLKELARIICGEIPYPETLYKHDIRVHKVSLDAVKNIR